MKFCRFCGAKLETPMKFCYKCGKALEPASIPVTQQPEPVVLQSASKNAGVSFRPAAAQHPSAVVFRQTDDDEEVSFHPASVQADEQPQGNVPPQPELVTIQQPVQTYAPPIYTQAAAAERPKKKSKRPFIIIAAVLAVVILGAMAFALRDPMAPINTAAKSVLYLECYDHTGYAFRSGSGFILNDRKIVITNYHVVDGTYQMVALDPYSGRSVEINNVLAYDEEADLAVLLCEEEIGLPPLELANSDYVRQGDKIYTVGYPLGLSHTLSDGLVSSLYLDNGIEIIQISAPISHGSSGGVLLNEKGKVIGVTSGGWDGGQNLNYAVSSNQLKQLLRDTYDVTPMSALYYK
ncbi:MAG: trypsin-like peptidase domain-containing protein [Oscillospiraceae bacterium]|nr:trypsin-like peptidase domain-containing protein [Oscillospiraceae bacterium]